MGGDWLCTAQLLKIAEKPKMDKKAESGSSKKNHPEAEVHREAQSRKAIRSRSSEQSSRVAERKGINTPEECLPAIILFTMLYRSKETVL